MVLRIHPTEQNRSNAIFLPKYIDDLKYITFIIKCALCYIFFDDVISYMHTSHKVDERLSSNIVC